MVNHASPLLLTLLLVALAAQLGEASYNSRCHKKGAKQVPAPIAVPAYRKRPVPAYQAAAPLALQPVAVPRTGYAPVTAVKAAYIEHDAHHDTVVHADCTLTTTRPAINLANFDHAIVGVHCASASAEVTVTMVSADTAKAVAKAWTPGTALLFQGVPMAGCGSDLARTIAANGTIKVDGADVTFATEQAHRADVIAEYDITVSSYAAPANATGLHRRGLFDWIKSAVHGGKQPTINVGVNWDPTKAAAIKSSIPITPASKANQIGTASCNNCYAKGAVGLVVSLKGNPFAVANYTVGITGQLDVAADLVLATPARKGQIVGYAGAVDISPVKVAGLFELRPRLALETGIQYDLSSSNGTDIGLTAGLDASVPFDLTMTMTSFKRGSKPKFTAQARTVFNPHSPRGLAAARASVTAHVSPRIELTGSVLFAGSFDVAGSVQASLGIEATSDGCGSDGKSAKLALFTDDSVDASVSIGSIVNSKYLLYASGHKALPCKFCSVCSADFGKKILGGH
ncbi:hypothetical protein BC828DRAFT_418085 [Blastocladiella britannica]|nr:hypothetical protein BC828DRAFT_418085 [Blastocladiella britannica]